MFFTSNDFALFGDNYVNEALASGSIFKVSDTEFISAENLDKALSLFKVIKIRDIDGDMYLKRDIALSKKDAGELVIVGEEGVFVTSAYYQRELANGNIVICDRGNEILFKENAVVTTTGEVLCLRHAQKYYTQCEDCGKWYPKSLIKEFNGKHLCLTCLRQYAYYCDHCHTYHLVNEPSHQVNVGNGNMETWCDNCFTNDAAECSHCHTIVPRYRIHSNGMCNECYEAFAEPIHRYGYKPTPRFYGEGDPDSTLYYGVELETDNGSSYDFARALLAGCDIEDDHYEPVKEVYCKSDGSLSSNGCEVVCHPCTSAYHLSDNSFWNTVTYLADRHGMKSHDARNSYGELDCGLHIHVSRKPFLSKNVEDYEEKIAMAFEKFSSEWQKIARRGSSRYAQYYGATDKETLKSEMRYGDRYHAVNTKNKATVEIRIFRGTIKLSTIKATLWAVSNLCERILNGLDTNTVENFTDLFDMESAPDYVKDYFIKKRIIAEEVAVAAETAEAVAV